MATLRHYECEKVCSTLDYTEFSKVPLVLMFIYFDYTYVVSSIGLAIRRRAG
jgi:hypothetical protein